MFVYSVGVIDWWNGWQKPEQVFASGVDPDNDRKAMPWEKWHHLWAQACAKARDIGWEGDIREGPFVTVLPHYPYGPYDEMNDFIPIAIGWKQDNNGDSFIASEIQIPWLERTNQIYRGSKK